MSVPSDQPFPGRPGAAAARVEELYEAHASTVRAICRSMLRDRVEAEDAEQQTFLSAQRALANGSRPDDPAAWLAVIARNECLARVRGRMREPLPVEEPEGGAAPDAHAAAVQRHEVAELRDALAELPAQQREALLLRELRGLSYEEVAVSLAVTTSAVESLLFRARRRLQSRLREALAGFFPWAAAKVAALALGAAVVTGSAVIATPHLLSHAPRSRAAPAHRHRVVRVAKRVSVSPAPAVGVWTTEAIDRPRTVATATKHEAGDGSRSERDDAPTSTTSEREPGDSTPTATTQPATTQPATTPEPSDDGTQAASATDD